MPDINTVQAIVLWPLAPLKISQKPIQQLSKNFDQNIFRKILQRRGWETLLSVFRIFNRNRIHGKMSNSCRLRYGYFSQATFLYVLCEQNEGPIVQVLISSTRPHTGALNVIFLSLNLSDITGRVSENQRYAKHCR